MQYEFAKQWQALKAYANSKGIKIMGDGELTKKLTVQAMKFTASAKAKIEAAGGKCEVL